MKEVVAPKIVADLFRQILLDRTVTVEKLPPFKLAPNEPNAAAAYENADGTLAGACICDLPLVHNAGAALCLIPADRRLSAPKLDPALGENFQEILNICAKLFAGTSQQRIRMRDVVFETAKRAPDVASLINNAQGRSDFKLTIQGYGSGRLSLFC